MLWIQLLVLTVWLLAPALAGHNKAYQILTENGFLQDTWLTALQRRGAIVETFHGFRGPTPGDDRIDWILTRGPVQTDAIQIITYKEGNQFPSDHFPVMAWVRIDRKTRD